MDGECCLLLDKKTKISDQPEDCKDSFRGKHSIDCSGTQKNCTELCGYNQH